ncbi:hypothetical protein F5Y11DRAFT_27052 [Daldinia sp. FL1419]|nr:hypothetical protein F5Y11DRAFT_27052 [Daldinia sp. FL1419]
MAIRWLLSLVCLLTPLSSAARGYSGGGLLDETVTQSVTETVTKYLSQCGTSPIPTHPTDITISGTITRTSTLQATTSVTIVGNVTNLSGAAPFGTTLSRSESNLPSPNTTHTPFTTGGTSYPVSNYSSTHANTTTLPCTTSSKPTPVSLGSSSYSTPCTTIPTTSHSTCTKTATVTAPNQIPVSESAKLGKSVAAQKLLGVLAIVTGITMGFI